MGAGVRNGGPHTRHQVGGPVGSSMTCRRPGCERVRRRKTSGRGGWHAWCADVCRWWVRTAEALADDGAAPGRDAGEDARALLCIGEELNADAALSDRSFAGLRDLRNAYQRA